jgi:membrane protease YdiL (CAAX protease family)
VSPLAALGRGLGGTFLVLAVVVLASLVAGTVRLVLPGHVLLATALMWVLAIPALLFLGAGLLGLDHAAMGVRPAPDGRRSRYVLGTAGGLVLVLLPALLGRLAGGYVPMPAEAVAALAVPTGARALPAVVFALPALMLAAAGEELLGTRGALLLSALLFVAVHVGNPGATPRGAIGVLLAGLVLGSVFLARGDLWTVAGAHLGWNAGEALVLGVPVSGITLPALVRWEVADSELWRGLLGSGFGPEEGLLFHGALGLAAGGAIVLATAAGAFKRPEDSADKA